MSTQQTAPVSSTLTPASQRARGSEKLLAAWRARALSEEAVNEIAAHLAQSPAQVEGASVAGGTSATGLTVALSYTGDDAPGCGNDIAFWLRWHLKHGGDVRPPRIIINGTPFPDLVQLVLQFGTVPDTAPAVNAGAVNVGGAAFGG